MKFCCIKYKSIEEKAFDTSYLMMTLIKIFKSMTMVTMIWEIYIGNVDEDYDEDNDNFIFL